MSEPNSKERHKVHREKNLIAKHLKENRDGLYRLRIVKDKTKVNKRLKITPKDIDKLIDDEENE